jgi:hypothetical protein
MSLSGHRGQVIVATSSWPRHRARTFNYWNGAPYSGNAPTVPARHAQDPQPKTCKRISTNDRTDDLRDHIPPQQLIEALAKAGALNKLGKRVARERGSGDKHAVLRPLLLSCLTLPK